MGIRNDWYQPLVFTTAWLVLLGCSSIPTGQDPNIDWKLDAKIKVNGEIYHGVGVVPKSETGYQIEIYPRSKIDVATISNCHRDKQIDATVIQKFLGSERQFKYTYRPKGGGLEDDNCPILFNVFDREKVTSLRAMIDFENEKWQLPAVTDCDGETKESIGISICQGKIKLLQRISFDETVRLVPTSKCGVSQQTGKIFYFKPQKGECPMVFQSLANPQLKHRCTVKGYEATYMEDMGK